MPGRPHHTNEMHDCVDSVMAKGDHDESSAYAICTAKFKESGKPIFEGAEAGSEAEIKLLAEFEAAGGAGSGNFGHKGRPGEIGGSSGEGGGGGGGGGGSEPATIHEIAKYGRNVSPDVVNEARRRHKEETGIEVDGQGKPIPVKGATKFSRNEIDSVDSVATKGFNSVSSADLKSKSAADVDSELKSAIKESNIHAEKAATSSGVTRTEFLKKSAEAYGRAQKLSNILVKKGGRSETVYAPWFRFLEGEKMAENARYLHLLGATGKTRTVQHEGRDHIVVPVVALVEGVIHAVNAPSAEFVPIEALSVAPQGWNGRPLMHGHPTKNGVQISANDPTVLADHSFGHVFNARLEGKKLLMDAYIDPIKAKKIGADRMLEKIQNGGMIEVSVGAFVTTETASGSHNGKDYKAKWKDVVPDHLAFLENKRGACSTEMGCGCPRVAMTVQDEDFRDTTEAELKAAEDLADAEAELAAAEAKVKSLKEKPAPEMPKPIWRGAATDEESLNERIECVSQAVNKTFGSNGVGLLPSSSYVYAAFVYDDHVIVKKDEKYFDVPYTIGEPNDTVTFGTPTEVEQTFVAAAGARHSSADQGMIQSVHDNTVAMGAKCSPEPLTAEMAYFIALRSTDEMQKIQGMHDNMKALGATCNRVTAYEESEIRDLRSISQEERDKIPAEDFAGPNRSFFIVEPEDVHNAAQSLGRTKGNTDTVKAKIISIAYRKGPSFVAKLPDDWKRKTDQKAAEATDPQLKAACGCKQGEKKMTVEERAASIKSLVEHKHSGFVAGDEKMLEGASDERLEALMVAAEARGKEVKAAQEAKDSPKTLTEEEFMKVAPAEIKSLVSRLKSQEVQRKAELVTSLKAAQSEFSESELSNMKLDDLERHARLLKLEVEEAPNYTGRAIPRTAADRAAADVFANPPDPYAAGIKELQETRKH